MSIQKLEIQILVENNSGPPGTLGESGFSALVKAQFLNFNFNILYDVGPSSVAFLHNIKNLKIDLKEIDAIILSHGHYDHVGGLNEAISLTKKDIPIICHPQALIPKWFNDNGKIIDVGIQGIIESPDHLRKQANLIETSSSHNIVESIITTGEISRNNDYEVLTGKLKKITTIKEDRKIKDKIEDDLSVIFKLADNSIVILAGCCHSGIVNTVEKTKELTGSNKITGIVGGLHLHDASDDRLMYTVRELEKYPIKKMAPCHCTGLRGEIALYSVFNKEFIDTMVASTIKFRSQNS